MPGETGDFLYVAEQAGVLVILCPASHHYIQGVQPGVFIHPSPTSGSEVFEFPFDALFALFCRSKMYYPTPFGLDSLDVKP